VAGWFADLFRLAWGLLYWNTRKSWFRLRRGRSRVPCQSLSDSGRAFETQCDACVSWRKRGRFRRVCPLLVDTPKGLRCSVDTADVRPFWGIAAKYYGGTALGLYAAGVVAVFIFLRTIGYPVSIVHVGLPPLWHKVGQARGWFFVERSNRAFAEGKTGEGLLYLANAYEFDPTNYVAGLALAKNYQAGQPIRSDQVFTQLLRDHPDKRHATAQDWYRALLARGDFEKIAPLARDETLSDAAQAGVWMRALLIATRQTGDDAPLRAVLEQATPAARAWHPLVETELLLRGGKNREARLALERTWAAGGAASGAAKFAAFYRVRALLQLREPILALDLLERDRALLDGDAYVTLRLDALALARVDGPYQRDIDGFLGGTLSLPKITILCGHLIRHPNPAIFARLYAKVERDGLPLNTETAGVWFSLLCTAGAVEDGNRLRELTGRLRGASSTPFVALGLIEAFFRGETVERRITSFLPILPLPLEVTYALIERYSPPAKRP
jgi:hypothetical protein